MLHARYTLFHLLPWAIAAPSTEGTVSTRAPYNADADDFSAPFRLRARRRAFRPDIKGADKDIDGHRHHHAGISQFTGAGIFHALFLFF